MATLDVTYFDIDGPALIRPVRHRDPRGYFSETWNRAGWAAAGLPAHDWVQDNEAFSAAPGTLRGLHFQAPPFAQAKLVRAIRGRIFDVAVDIRKGSPTYGKAITVTLEAETGDQLLVPRGFAHGYQTLTSDALIAYKCDAPYNANAEAGLSSFDTDLDIHWPAPEPAILNDRDRTWPALATFNSPFEPVQ